MCWSQLAVWRYDVFERLYLPRNWGWMLMHWYVMSQIHGGLTEAHDRTYLCTSARTLIKKRHWDDAPELTVCWQ